MMRSVAARVASVTRGAAAQQTLWRAASTEAAKPAKKSRVLPKDEQSFVRRLFYGEVASPQVSSKFATVQIVEPTFALTPVCMDKTNVASKQTLFLVLFCCLVHVPHRGAFALMFPGALRQGVR
jgi:hypothetical protein